jgi:hypothetical protein
MFILIYDYDNDCGIEEHFETWQEANNNMNQLKTIDGYHNFTIVNAE